MRSFDNGHRPVRGNAYAALAMRAQARERRKSALARCETERAGPEVQEKPDCPQGRPCRADGLVLRLVLLRNVRGARMSFADAFEKPTVVHVTDKTPTTGALFQARRLRAPAADRHQMRVLRRRRSSTNQPAITGEKARMMTASSVSLTIRTMISPAASRLDRAGWATITLPCWPVEHLASHWRACSLRRCWPLLCRDRSQQRSAPGVIGRRPERGGYSTVLSSPGE